MVKIYLLWMLTAIIFLDLFAHLNIHVQRTCKRKNCLDISNQLEKCRGIG